MSAASPYESEHLQAQHLRRELSKDPSAETRLSRSGTPLRQSEGDPEGEGDDDYYEDDDLFEEYFQNHERLPSVPAQLDLELPESELDLTMTFDSILAEIEPKQEMDRVQKRASNVMKLAEQNEKLKEELRAMTERLEAAERKQKDLESLAQQHSTEDAGGAH